MTRLPSLSRRHALAAVLAAAGATAVGGPAFAQSKEVNVYSSRHYSGDKAMYAKFTEMTGIKINVVEGDIGPLMQRLKAEGANSPADVLVTVDAGNLWRAQSEGLFQPIKSAVLDETIPERLRDPEGQWYAFSYRARVIMVNKDKIPEGAIKTYEDLADPKWKGKILVRSSTNIYNQSLLSSMIKTQGAEKTEAWAKALVANFARAPKGGDTDQLVALAAGEGDIAITNTYYLARLVASAKPEDRAVAAKIRPIFPNQADRGTHVNVSGAGVTKNAPNKDNAVKLLEFLMTPEAQVALAEGNHEYPVRQGVAVSSVIQSWGPFKADAVNITELGKNNPEAVRIADRAGWK